MSDEFRKVCTKCKGIFPIQMFSVRGGVRDGLQSYCKDCVKKNEKNRREKIKSMKSGEMLVSNNQKKLYDSMSTNSKKMYNAIPEIGEVTVTQACAESMRVNGTSPAHSNAASLLSAMVSIGLLREKKRGLFSRVAVTKSVVTEKVKPAIKGTEQAVVKPNLTTNESNPTVVTKPRDPIDILIELSLLAGNLKTGINALCDGIDQASIEIQDSFIEKESMSPADKAKLDKLTQLATLMKSITD